MSRLEEIEEKWHSTGLGITEIEWLISQAEEVERLSEALAGMRCQNPQYGPGGTVECSKPTYDCGKCPPCLARVERAKREEKK